MFLRTILIAGVASLALSSAAVAQNSFTSTQGGRNSLNNLTVVQQGRESNAINTAQSGAYNNIETRQTGRGASNSLAGTQRGATNIGNAVQRGRGADNDINVKQMP
jgi:thymidine phosphorylase